MRICIEKSSQNQCKDQHQQITKSNLLIRENITKLNQTKPNRDKRRQVSVVVNNKHGCY